MENRPGRKRKVLAELGISRSTYYRWRQGQHRPKHRVRPWNRITPNEERRILAVAREFPELSSRQLSAWITDHEGFAVSELTVYRILRREGLVKRQEIHPEAAREYHTKTTRPHRMWATDASYFRVVGWGYYYLGGKLVAMSENQDHLTGTSLMTDTNGDPIGAIMKYYPFGECLESQGSLATDKLFTGQRLDGTGLYYYGARYYDPTIGRFVSPDTFMLSPSNPQGLNRYTYAFNNPLRFNDPSGNWPPILDKFISQAKDALGQGINAVKEGLQVAASKTVEIYQTAKELPGKAQEAAMHAVGIERVEYYTDTRSITDHVPVYHVSDQGIVPSLLGDVSGISLYPIGTFVKESALSIDPNLPAHEAFHYSEQRDWGMLWYLGYGIEVAARDIYYWDTYWGYYTSSFEQRAREYAGQQSRTPPEPKLQEPLNRFTQSASNYFETIGNFYYGYYNYFWYYGY